MRSCNCTNQCPACGQCCRVRCGHRGVAPATTGIAIGTATPTTPRPLSEDDIRRIIREEIERAA